jgi:hypothetical protein
MIKRTPSEISDIVSRNRKDFTKDFFVHLHRVADSYNNNPKAQTGETHVFNLLKQQNYIPLNGIAL